VAQQLLLMALLHGLSLGAKAVNKVLAGPASAQVAQVALEPHSTVRLVAMARPLLQAIMVATGQQEHWILFLSLSAAAVAGEHKAQVLSEPTAEPAAVVRAVAQPLLAQTERPELRTPVAAVVALAIITPVATEVLVT
jgi:hypothetical protein